MKATKKLLSMVAALAFITIYVSSAFAEWCTCSVDRIGYAVTGDLIANLTTSAPCSNTATEFTNTKFTVPTDHEKEFLAIFLTAQMNGWSVNANVDCAVLESRPPITGLYLISQ